MTVYTVIQNVQTQKFYTGEYYEDDAWTADILKAKEYSSFPKAQMEFIEEHNFNFKKDKGLSENPRFEIKTIIKA